MFCFCCYFLYPVSNFLTWHWIKFIIRCILLQYFYLVHHTVNAACGELLPCDLRQLFCPDIRYRYCIDHARLHRRLRPQHRILKGYVKVYIAFDARDLAAARVLPPRYITVNIRLEFLIRLIIKPHCAIAFVVSSHP